MFGPLRLVGYTRPTDSAEGRAFALHAADPGTIPSTLYVSPSTDKISDAESREVPEHLHL